VRASGRCSSYWRTKWAAKTVFSHFPQRHVDIPKEVMLGITPNAVERLYTKRIVYKQYALVA
jgi:hypothetical protein